MKKENGLGIILMIIIICLIVVIAGWGVYLYINIKSDVKENSIKSDMLLIEGACRVCYETNVMNKTTDELIGTKLSEIEDNEEITKTIIDDFKAMNIVKEKDYDNYYVLTNKDLEELKVAVTNHEGSYYIVGYEKDDIIITMGYEGKYRLAEFTGDPIPEDDDEEEEEDSEGEDDGEENADDKKEDSEENEDDEKEDSEEGE